MRIDDKLAFGLRVIEHRHFAVCHHHQLLFLERMQPADKDMTSDAAGEIECRERDVGNIRIEVTASMRRTAPGKLPEQVEEHRDVVRREAPKYVLFRSKSSQI